MARPRQARLRLHRSGATFYNSVARTGRSATEHRLVMKKKTAKRIQKSVRKALRRHTFASGLTVGAATATVLAVSGITRRLSDALAPRLADLLRARRDADSDLFRDLRYATGDVFTRVGHFFHPQETEGQNGEHDDHPQAGRTRSES